MDIDYIMQFYDAETTDNSHLDYTLNPSMRSMQHLYLMKCNEYYKIGIGYDPEKRIKELQCGNPYEITLIKAFEVENAQYVENMIHHRLARYHHRLEWFKLPERVVRWLCRTDAIK